jgi:hypothetical protein
MEERAGQIPKGDGDRVLMEHNRLFIDTAAFLQSFAALRQPQVVHDGCMCDTAA